MYKEGYPAEKGDPLSRLVMMPVVGHGMMNILFPLVGKIMVRSIMKATFAPEPVLLRFILHRNYCRERSYGHPDSAPYIRNKLQTIGLCFLPQLKCSSYSMINGAKFEQLLKQEVRIIYD
ncbi:hypothetical protein J2Z70_000615 [Paenibacillus silagei]|uniref:Uncharacterized protein n=1 Tax=Paenibacillus silagei TaxID=1670801 RepID=A0ABS4NKA4_9BACL|nr:hypothetical protein [Paenibacillus silagei]